VPSPISTTTAPTASATPSATPFTETPGAAGLTRITTISGQITPKSVVASGDGIVVADNMIYSHTVTVYDRNFKLLKTIPDSVDAAAFGVPGHPGTSHGGPVEAAFTPDKKYFYVSNYSMYGAGWGPEGHDTCSPGSHFGTSTVYRINRATLTIDQVIPVGVVPKFLEVTPDGTKVLVSNWCSYAVSVIDVASAKQIQLIPVGAYPRGIAITADSKTAYISIMGGSNLIKMDLTTYAKTSIAAGGVSPRHLILDPTGRYLYVTLNGSGTVTKLDTTTNQIVARRATGSDPRSMAMSPDGQFLYVVNYLSSSMTKIRASDFSIAQTVTTNQHPIGITVDAGTGRVWVADYGGTIEVFADRR
jgi:YVTN family beta-propeller protein